MDMKTPPHHNSAVQPANSPKSNSASYRHSNTVHQQQQIQHQHQQQNQQQILQQSVQELPSINRKGSAGSVSPRSCNRTEGQGVSATVCANCGTTTTPLWRRAPNGETICNACGLYLKARNTVRPPWLKRNAIKKSTPAVSETPDNNNSNGTCPGDGHCDGTGGSSSCDGCPAFNQHQVNRQALICANCGTNTTPLWRRDESGNTICNACGLYFKLHNVHRPVTMKRSVIKRRKRVALATSPPPPTNQSGGSDNEHSSRKSRIHHPPTPASTSGSERGYISSEDEISVDDLSLSNRKRKSDDLLISNKRRCNSNARQVPPIEDYVCSKLNSSMWDDRRKRSLSPVEPLLANQVHIHHNNRIMGTPSVPLPSVFPPQYNNDGSSSPSHNSSSSISALLNPTTPTSSVHPQLPPLSSIPSANMVSSNSPSHVGLSIPTNNPISTHQPQSNSVSDRNSIQLLQAHRQELQREVSHLSMLLNKTTAILVDLDKAISSNGSIPNTPYGSPDRSLTNSGNNFINSHTIHHGMPTPPSDAYISLPPLAPSGSDGSVSR